MEQSMPLRLTLVILTLLTLSSSALAQPTTVQAPAARQATTHQVARYPTVEMHRGKLQQDKSSGVVYLDARQREERRLVLQNGLFYDHTGKTLINTRSKHRNQNNYVMDASGSFYLFDEFTHPETRHSSIFAGGPVAGAGNITIQEGHVLYIDSDSGHYDSSSLQGNVLKELASQGVTIGGPGKTPEAKQEKTTEKTTEKTSKKGKKGKKEKKAKHQK
jgi:hypothetical protein